MAACAYGCGATTELRPYGPGGAPVCFECAMATPEREAVTNAAMHAVMDAAEAMSPVSGLVLDVDGFHPATPEMGSGIHATAAAIRKALEP